MVAESSLGDAGRARRARLGSGGESDETAKARSLARLASRDCAHSTDSPPPSRSHTSSLSPQAAHRPPSEPVEPHEPGATPPPPTGLVRPSPSSSSKVGAAVLPPR